MLVSKAVNGRGDSLFSDITALWSEFRPLTSLDETRESDGLFGGSILSVLNIQLNFDSDRFCIRVVTVEQRVARAL